MRIRTTLSLFAIAAALAGCRREDIREFTVEIPDLTPDKQPAIVKALAGHQGITDDAPVWDFDKKTLTVKYDSMQTAKTNIRMLIEDAGLKVVYPEKTGPAGYINTRK